MVTGTQTGPGSMTGPSNTNLRIKTGQFGGDISAGAMLVMIVGTLFPLLAVGSQMTAINGKGFMIALAAVSTVVPHTLRDGKNIRKLWLAEPLQSGLFSSLRP